MTSEIEFRVQGRGNWNWSGAGVEQCGLPPGEECENRCTQSKNVFGDLGKPWRVGAAVLELCLAWVCVHPLLVAQQAEGGGGNVCLVLAGAEPGQEPQPRWDVPFPARGSWGSGMGAECSGGLRASPWHEPSICGVASSCKQGIHTGRRRSNCIFFFFLL